VKKLKAWGFGIRDGIYIVVLLGGFFAGYYKTIGRIEKSQAIMDEKMANLQTDFNEHKINQRVDTQKILDKLDKQIEKIYSIESQISDP